MCFEFQKDDLLPSTKGTDVMGVFNDTIVSGDVLIMGCVIRNCQTPHLKCMMTVEEILTGIIPCDWWRSILTYSFHNIYIWKFSQFYCSLSEQTPSFIIYDQSYWVLNTYKFNGICYQCYSSWLCILSVLGFGLSPLSVKSSFCFIHSFFTHVTHMKYMHYYGLCAPTYSIRHVFLHHFIWSHHENQRHETFYKMVQHSGEKKKKDEDNLEGVKEQWRVSKTAQTSVNRVPRGFLSGMDYGSIGGYLKGGNGNNSPVNILNHWHQHNLSGW